MIDRVIKPIDLILNRQMFKRNKVQVGKTLSINGRIYIMGNNIIKKLNVLDKI